MDMFKMQHESIRLRPLAVAAALGIVAFVLVLTSLALETLSHLGGQDLLTFFTGRVHEYGVRGLFSLDNELNIPAMFSTGLLLFASLLLLVITLHEISRGTRDAARWAILSAGFLLMAIDEAASIHERLIEPGRQLLGPGNHGIFYFAWVIPGLVLVLMLGAFFLRFLLRLPAETRIIFIIAGALYLGGAIGMELINGRHAEIHGTQMVYHLMVTAEEGLEMAGATLFIYGLLRHLAGHYPLTLFAVSDRTVSLPAAGTPTMTAQRFHDSVATTSYDPAAEAGFGPTPAAPRQ